MSAPASLAPTNPFGRCFVSYRRVRLPEITELVRALHELGVPTWQDLNNLDEEPLEPALREALADPNTASAVLWVTPDVTDSPIITNLEVPGLTRRATADNIFALVPVAAGGLDYDSAADAARSATTTTDLRTWNIARVKGDPATADDIHDVALRTLRRRVRAIHAYLEPAEPFIIDVYTRTPATLHPDAALTMDLTHLFDGRHAKDGAWNTVIRAIRTTLTKVAAHAPGRPVHLRGLVGLPTAVTLGSQVPAPAGLDVSWAQRTPGRPHALYTVSGAGAPNGFTVHLEDGIASAADVAVLVNVSEDTTPAFQATAGLGPYRGLVRATPTSGHPHFFASPGEALELARDVVRAIRSTRSRYGTIGEVHLFIAGPAGLAFLIGQLLNTLGVVVTYEHTSVSGTGNYTRAAVLEPST